MPPASLALTLLLPTLAVCRLAPDAPPPPWAMGGDFWALTRTPDELSVVCLASAVPAGVRAETGWRALMVAGPLDFALVGILRSLAVPLAEAGVSIFAVSTFDTDYLLVRAEQLARAVAALERAGHTVAGRSC